MVVALLLHPASVAASAEPRIVNAASDRQRLGETIMGSLKGKGTAKRQLPMRHFSGR
jgi:hypothetical protein